MQLVSMKKGVSPERASKKSFINAIIVAVIDKIGH